MTRLHIISEGQTEELTVRNVIANYLGEFSISVDVRSVETSRVKPRYTLKGVIPGKIFRGGLLNYQHAREDIIRWMLEDHSDDCFFTTMFDFYALPDDFPGKAKAAKTTDPYKKVRIIENEFADDIKDRRFIPYIQLHEFEALIFADLQYLTTLYFEYRSDILQLIKTTDKENPELIDEGAETAPSKRIIKIIPEYNKKIVGSMIIEEIGIPTLRDKCQHFREWLDRLKALGE